MKLLENLFRNNQNWARSQLAHDPEFFNRNIAQQSPPFFWIGCSDSRVPANEIIGLPPGDLFVHRNVANLIVHKDSNSLAALQYAIKLGVDHVLIVGHYGCAGVKAAMQEDRMPEPIGEWLEPLRQLYRTNFERFEGIADPTDRAALLCELNVIEQVRVARSLSIMQEAWASGRDLAIHGWIYDMRNGRLRDLNVTVSPSLENTSGGPAA